MNAKPMRIQNEVVAVASMLALSGVGGVGTSPAYEGDLYPLSTKDWGVYTPAANDASSAAVMNIEPADFVLQKVSLHDVVDEMAGRVRGFTAEESAAYEQFVDSVFD